MAGITVSRGIVKWFTGHEMALAMGIEMAIARVGVAVVMIGSPALASIAPVSVSRPVAASLLLVCIGLICFVVYGFMDKKLDAQGAEEEKDDPFKGSDIGKFTGYYYTASMAAQVVTPIVAGTLMRKIDYRVLFPYAALFVALSFVTMLFVHHGDAKAEAKKGLEAFEEMDD